MKSNEDKYEDWDINNLTGKQGFQIVYGETYRFACVSDTIEKNSRWDEHHRSIIKDILTGKYYMTYYSQGLTEKQENLAFEWDDEADFVEVFEIEVTVKKYLTSKEIAKLKKDKE